MVQPAWRVQSRGVAALNFLLQSAGMRISSRPLIALLVASCLASLAGCVAGSMPSSGPSEKSIRTGQATSLPGLEVITVTPEVTRRLLGNQNKTKFSEAWGAALKPGNVLGFGDVVEVSVWEAPPAMLFGVTLGDSRQSGGMSTARNAVLPEQVVNASGEITIPFVGAVTAAGRTLEQLQADIAQRLQGKANQPQVLARVLRNVSSNVTVVGDVAQAQRMPITAKGERLLDALAASGGVRQPVGKISLQITRGSTVLTQPLEQVIAEPSENILLQPGDVITALFQPFSLTVLGATGTNREVDFEAQGISLAQALGRVNGLQDYRADARGVFIFRYEAGKPVVYRVDLKDAAAFFVAQDFPMRHKDVLYVANSPAVELQKFLNILGSVVAPASTLRNF